MVLFESEQPPHDLGEQTLQLGSLVENTIFIYIHVLRNRFVHVFGNRADGRWTGSDDLRPSTIDRIQSTGSAGRAGTAPSTLLGSRSSASTLGSTSAGRARSSLSFRKKRPRSSNRV